jgi:hypothetical protein
MATAADLSFIVHSGYGNQLQSLLAAVYVANVTGSGLLVPPLMSHRASPKIFLKATRSCNPRIFSGSDRFGVDTRKQAYATRATRAVNATCKRSSNDTGRAELVMDQWHTLFDLPAFLVSSRSVGCMQPPWSCPAVDIDLHLATAVVNGNCTKDLPCHDLIDYAKSVLRTHVAVGTNPRKTLCLGVLNDCTRMLRPCS